MEQEKTEQKKAKITKDMKVADVIENYGKDAAFVMLSFGLHCVGCGAAAFDTIEQGSKLHGMSDDEINDLVDELNRVVSEETNN